MMKKICAVVLFFICVFSVGVWEGTFEKRWVVNTTPNSEKLILKGVFIADSPYQNITIVETSIATDTKKENENYYVVYERDYPERENLVYAKARVFSCYAPKIKEDPLLTGQPIFSENEKTMYNEFIKAKADGLKKETVLETMVALNDFVHEYVNYNESAAEENSAIEVYANPQGVCVEYAHLLMAMLNAVGIENRMVYGYAYSKKWEPHVWVEAYIPGYGWMDVDPTYGQVGFLDGRRIAMNINTKKERIYDYVQLKNGEVDFEYSLYTNPEHEGDFDLVTINISYNWPYFIVSVENKNDFYVFGAYEINFPANISDSERKTIILRPREAAVFKYRINEGELSDGYVYFVDIKARFVDDVEEKRFEIRKPAVVVEKHNKEKEWWEIIIEEIMKLFGLYSGS
ncbi:MAG: transglutaminase-like domain-containing protein [Candidatus Anstonellales archaeon]